MSSQQPNGDGKKNEYAANTYKISANEVMKSQGEDIRRWSRQNKNPLLKKLAQEVLDIVEDEKSHGISGDSEKKSVG